MWRKKKSVLREELYIPKRQTKRPKRSENVPEKKGFHWIAFFLWLTFLGTVIYMLLFSPVMNIDVLESSGMDRVPRSAVEEYFAKEREARTWYVLKHQNYFLFNIKKFEKELRAEYPAIEYSSVWKKFPNRIHIEFTERPLAILWCSGGPCALLDSQNITHEGHLVPEKVRELPLFTVIDTGGLPVTLGEPLFDYPFVKNFESNKTLLEQEFGIRLKPEVFSSSRFSDELRFQTENGYELFLNSRLSPAETMRSLRLFFEQEYPQDKQGELKSIDLRTEKRIYYTLKNPELAPLSEEEKKKQEEQKLLEEKTKKEEIEKKKKKEND